MKLSVFLILASVFTGAQAKTPVKIELTVHYGDAVSEFKIEKMKKELIFHSSKGVHTKRTLASEDFQFIVQELKKIKSDPKSLERCPRRQFAASVKGISKMGNIRLCLPGLDNWTPKENERKAAELVDLLATSALTAPTE